MKSTTYQLKLIILSFSQIILILLSILILTPLYLQSRAGQPIENQGTQRIKAEDTTYKPKRVPHVESPQQNNTLKENLLEIPSIRILSTIVTSSNPTTLEKAIWHLDGSGTPISGGNMIITGHRFQYLPPYKNSLFNVHKLNIGESIIIHWQGQPYQYTVTQKYEITPNNQIISKETQRHQITLYTCSPIWTNKRRLVIIAKPSPNRT